MWYYRTTRENTRPPENQFVIFGAPKKIPVNAPVRLRGDRERCDIFETWQ